LSIEGTLSLMAHGGINLELPSGWSLLPFSQRLAL